LTPDDFRYLNRRGEKTRKMSGGLAQLPAIAALKTGPFDRRNWNFFA
jgi:hypothetical protein